MNNEKSNNQFKNTLNSNSGKLFSKKKEIMKKYNLSESQVEKIIHEAKKRNEITSEKKNMPKNSKNENLESISHNIDNQKNSLNHPPYNRLNYTDTQENNSQLNQTKKYVSVDNVLKDIIPSYEKQLSIELNNVDLIFDVSSDKIDNLKEQFIRTITRTKSKKTKFQALYNISLKIYKGEKIGIIGYNGAGKSTLLNVITGIYPPTIGTVKTYGNISPLLSLGAGFDSNYTGRENILLNGAVLGYEKKYLLSKFDEIIEFSELEEFIDIPIKNYSSGMLAKLGFSIATIVNPDILIIDEILGVGDVNFQRKSSDKIKSLMDGGTTVILVSHSIPQIRELCDKAIWIDKGKIREIGEVNEVCDRYLKDSQKASKEQLQNIQMK